MPESKPIIGILASHDSEKCNRDLIDVLDFLVENYPEFVKSYQFAITRGTYRRVLKGECKDFSGVRDTTRDFLLNCGVLRLPCREHGGVVMLADLVVKRKMKVVWPFLTPVTSHWLNSENLALMRLCDQCRANRLMNDISVVEWVRGSLNVEKHGDGERWPPRFGAGGVKPEDDDEVPVRLNDDGSYAIEWDAVKRMAQEALGPTLALIAHDEMKARIEEFILDYQRELHPFSRIITTGTTGKIVQDIAPRLANKVRRYNSGPKGGDIEIAVEMIFKRCDVAVFLVDPQSAHPHSEDIKVLFGAAILNRVRLLTNERQARAWMDRTKGNLDECREYTEYKKARRSERILKQSA